MTLNVGLWDSTLPRGLGLSNPPSVEHKDGNLNAKNLAHFNHWNDGTHARFYTVVVPGSSAAISLIAVYSP